MPDIDDGSTHDCPECGEPMYWTEAAVRNPDLLARTARGVESTIAYVDAYRCANGHTSKECPLCGSYETAAWRDSDGPLHYHVICSACGNDSVTQS
jgi:predicted RNA-binding Zn-ribbon protein involved in translation (DUF1610 family)